VRVFISIVSKINSVTHLTSQPIYKFRLYPKKKKETLDMDRLCLVQGVKFEGVI
jgi:hypothetical protein